MTEKTVLVTGATGFIGRHCVAELSARGFDVHATTSADAPRSSAAHWHRINLLDGNATRSLVDAIRPRYLLHLAWYAKHRLFWQAPENHDWVNASICLTNAFIENGGRRAVFAGTCAEYDWTDGVCRESSTPLKPQGLYGASKNAFRLLAEEAVRRAGISCAWGRIFFLYGPDEQPGRLVPTIVKSQLDHDRFICASGDLQRDYLYVSDVASAFTALLDSEIIGAVNLGSGQAIPIRTIVERIVARLGHPELIEYAAQAPASDAFPLVVADTARLAGELHWTPRIDLEHGLDLTIDWWRQHFDTRGT